MKQIRLDKLYELGILTIVGLIVVHAPLSVALGTLAPDLGLIVKAWKEILMAPLGIAAVVLVTRKKMWPVVLAQPVIVLSLAFIDIHLLLSLFSGADTASVIAGLMIDLRFVLVFILAYVLIALRPTALGRLFKTIIGGAGIVIGFGILQITVLPDNVLSYLGYSSDTITPYTTIDRNPDFVRINSTLRGPNPLGALLVIYCSMLIAYFIFKRRQLMKNEQLAAILAGIAAIAVLFASYSRSAYLAAVTSAGLAIVAAGKITKKWLIGIATATVILGLAVVLMWQTAWFSNVILHENPESASQAKSNEGHIESLTEGAARVVSEPFGSGVGTTGSASLLDVTPKNDVIVENYYLFIAHESGWLGLIVFLALYGWILVSMWRSRTGRWLSQAVFVSGIGLGLIAIVLPVWADDTVSIIWWVLAGAAMARISGIMDGGDAKRTSKQKTARTA